MNNSDPGGWGGSQSLAWASVQVQPFLTRWKGSVVGWEISTTMGASSAEPATQTYKVCSQCGLGTPYPLLPTFTGGGKDDECHLSSLLLPTDTCVHPDNCPTTMWISATRAKDLMRSLSSHRKLYQEPSASILPVYDWSTIYEVQFLSTRHPHGHASGHCLLVWWEERTVDTEVVYQL